MQLFNINKASKEFSNSTNSSLLVFSIPSLEVMSWQTNEEEVEEEAEAEVE